MISSSYDQLEYKKVLRPIIFLDQFSYPVTGFEVWKFLDKKEPLLKIENILNDLVERKVLQEKRGFYFLSGKENFINVRRERYNYSVAKFKKAKFFSRLFTLFPGVLMTALANNIGSHNLREGSDIDFFIVTKKNNLWRSRLFCAGIAKLLFSRPTKRNKKDTVCLSFYVSEAAMDLKNFELSGGDPYLDYWHRGLVLIDDKKNTWKKFQAVNSLEGNIIQDNNYEKPSKIGLWLEGIAKNIQMKIMPNQLREAMNKSEGVLINDDVLKLYLKERRKQFRERFNLKKYEVFKNIN